MAMDGAAEPLHDGRALDGRVELSTPLWPTSLQMPARQDAEVVDLRDADTPDKWIQRNKHMVRLTGRHPFNAEPPLPKLQEAGWITPPALHVVRNHGSVPQLSWDSHRLKVSGVPNPCELSMDEIASGMVGPVVSFPVTFICAGNRRKEQNMTKKTVGFNWGAGSVANSVWTGVRLCDVLAYVGITRPSREHRFVCFEGPEGELPQGKTGSYGTSIDMGWALDRERDVLLAFKQNGELLTPDHGAPLRTLLPGCIGGRMVKWLSRLWVSDQPSDNHYHYFDNRVLPPHVDAEVATAEGWWHKPDYIINHMNTNSAMFEPRHNSVFSLGGPKAQKTVKVAGYAYAGGGLKVIRAEISLDEGRSWEIADLTRPEDEIAEARGTDKHWCWAWWETEVDAVRLLQCKELCCRAVDCNQNMQPAHLTWNVMGMMNNCLFRVKVHPMTDAYGFPAVWFEHPTMPGSLPGGWMTEDAGKFDPAQASEAAAGPRGSAPHRPAAAVWGQAAPRKPAAAAAAVPGVVAASFVKPAGKLVTSKEEWLRGGISQEEVAKHNGAGSAWIVVKGRVYDATPYLEAHPGGASSILLVAGQEASEDFEAVHSKKAWSMLEDYYIGPLKPAAEPAAPLAPAAPSHLADASASSASPSSSSGGGGSSSSFLNPRLMQTMPLLEKIVVSHDTRIFRFGLPTPTTKLGLPTGMHMFLKARVNGQVVMRPYTPMTDDNTLGHVDFLVKVYFANVHPRFPDGGKMSQHLESMATGDTIEVKGPIGEFVYLGKGSFTWHEKPRSCKRINMVAGGTGLTPCWQVANAVLRDPEDQTCVSLVYANQTPGDILAREQLDQLALEHPGRFRVWYTVDRVPEGVGEWKFDTGFVSDTMLQQHLFAPSPDTITVMCGPPVMVERAVVPNLQKLGHEETSYMCF